MRVYLATGTPYPHPVIKELINYPPVEYVSPRRWGDQKTGFALEDLYWTAQATVMRQMSMLGLPKVAYVPTRDVDLIHACQFLILNRKPWVAEVPDHPGCFGYSRSFKQLNDNRFKRMVEDALASPRCRKILPYTTAMKKYLEDFLDADRFGHKIEIVNPAHHPVDVPEKERGDKVRLLFIGSRFYAKGGRELLAAFRALRERYPGRLKLTMVCHDIPLEIHEAFWCDADLELLPSLAEHGALLKQKAKSLAQRLGAPVPLSIPQETIDRLYQEADIFVYPTMAAGMFVYLESMAHGLPIVATDVYNSPEFVEDGVTGFLVKGAMPCTGPGFLSKWQDFASFVRVVERSCFPELIDELMRRIAILVENPELRVRMGQEAMRRERHGRFSIQERNTKLRRIYAEALDSHVPNGRGG